MQIQTKRFGLLNVDETKMINFFKGLPGFETLRNFIILPVEGTEDIHWLQSAESPEIAFMVIDPFKFFQGYVCQIPEPDIEELELEKPEETLILTTITIPHDKPAQATANLVAPIVINTKTNRSKQVILSGSPYKTKHQLFQVENKKKKDNKKTSGEGRK